MYTWTACTTNRDVDVDQDGLSDSCEYTLADQFAPKMIFWANDDVSREPHWAARWDDNETVVIVYMISYWVDAGDTGNFDWWCGQPFIPFTWLFHDPTCGGHAGDSEYITLTVQYNEDTHHWVLVAAALSGDQPDVRYFFANTKHNLIDTNDGNALQWVNGVGGVPYIWVANGKHGNFATLDQCNNGGKLGSADCSGPRDSLTLETGLQNEKNVGSRSFPFSDCVPTDSTSHPNYSPSTLECYWTYKTFHGWYPNQPDVGQLAYTSVLTMYGF